MLLSSKRHIDRRGANHAICSFIDLIGYASGPIRRCLFIDYIIITFKVKRSAKNTRLDFLSYVSMVTAEDSGAFLFPIGYRQIA